MVKSSQNGPPMNAKKHFRSSPRKCSMLRRLLSYILPVGCLLGALLFGSSALAAAGELKTVTFLPQWLPQAQFAGYYVAYEKGFYKKHGIDLKILRGGPGFPSDVMLSRKQADVTTLFLSDAIQQRDRNVQLINIGQIVQRSGYMLVAKKGSGISRPEDLNSRKVSLWQSFSVQPQSFFRRYKITVRPVVQGTTVNLFLRGGVDAASAMWYNEYHAILNAGWDENELTLFFFHQYGLNFPEDGIYVLEETFRRDPALYCSFVRASVEGWNYAFEHRKEALDIVMRYAAEAHTGTNRTHQQWMLDRMKDLILPEGSRVPMGVLESGGYQTVAEELLKAGLIRQVQPFDRFYVDCLRDGYHD